MIHAVQLNAHAHVHEHVVSRVYLFMYMLENWIYKHAKFLSFTLQKMQRVLQFEEGVFDVGVQAEQVFGASRDDTSSVEREEWRECSHDVTL